MHHRRIAECDIVLLFDLWKYSLVPGFHERLVVLENLGFAFVLVGWFVALTNPTGTKEPRGKHCVKNSFVSPSEISRT